MIKLVGRRVAAEPETRTCTFTIGSPPSGCYGSQRLWNCLAHRNLRYDRFLYPVRSHHNRLSHKFSAYKSSTMVPFNLHHHFHSSRALRGQTLLNLYLLLTLLPPHGPYVLSSIRYRDALQVLRRFLIPPRLD